MPQLLHKIVHITHDGLRRTLDLLRASPFIGHPRIEVIPQTSHSGAGAGDTAAESSLLVTIHTNWCTMVVVVVVVGASGDRQQRLAGALVASSRGV